MTVRELLDQLDLQGESHEEVYVWNHMYGERFRLCDLHIERWKAPIESGGEVSGEGNLVIF
jgi:hypothetical protein